MATPPFLPDETKPGASDLISLFPNAEQLFRDVLEDWILWEHNTGGTHKQVSLDDISTPTIPATLVGIWHESGVLKTRFAGGTVYDLLTSNTGLKLSGGTLTGDLVLAGAPDADLKAATKKYVDDADVLKAPLASPALTGNPTAPTQTVGNDSTRLATTAFVQDANPITRFASVATTSGSSKEFTGIQAGAERLTFMMSEVSLDGDEEFEIQIGDGGGYELFGYVSVVGSSGGETAGATDAYLLNRRSDPGDKWSGTIVFTRHGGNLWVMAGSIGSSAAIASLSTCAGSKTLSTALTKIRIFDTGANSFDNGSIALLVE